MADKFSVLIKYKYLEYIDNARLSDADSWVLIRSVIEYDKNGTEPLYQTPVLYGLFAVIKLDLDQNREKWEEVSFERSKAGKKGGAKKGNQNARKNKQNGQGQAKQPNACLASENKQNGQKQHDSGSDLDLGYDLDHESGGCNNSPEFFGTAKDEKPPPPFFEIKAKANEQGFFLDDKDVGLLISKTDPTWFGENSFIEFIAETIRERPGYAEKPRGELHSLFRKMIMDAANLREEYPSWKVKREKKALVDAQIKAREDAYRKAKEPPSICPGCGGSMKLWEERNCIAKCESCEGWCIFIEEDHKWDFQNFERGSE